MNRLEHRIALRNVGSIDPEEIDDYRGAGKGYEGLARALSMAPRGVIEELRRSTLRGRGGAGYPTAEKWQAVSDARGSVKYVVCDAVDGDPRSRAAQVILEGDPHSVLEGMVIAAYGVGASRCIVAVAQDARTVISRLEKAIGQMRERAYLGNSILGRDFSCDIDVREIARTLVAGEETALLRALEGNQAVCSGRPPFPSDAGYDGNPTLVENVETLSNISAIFLKGADWFLTSGTAASKGSKVITLTGAVANPCTVEVPFGTPLGRVIEELGGTPGTDITAAQIGGPTGAFVDVRDLDMPIAFETIGAAGGMMGSGSVDVVPTGTCIVEVTEALMSYIHDQSCGKCVFCREGTLQMADILADIAKGEGKLQDLDLLTELGEEMKIGALCGLGKSAPNPVLSAIRLFREGYESHIKGRKCPKEKINSKS